MFEWLGSKLADLILDRFIESKKNKPKICCSLEYRHSDDLIPVERRTKTSDTGYSVKIYNVGNVPIIIENVSIYNNKDIIVGYLEFGTDYSYTLHPYESVSCTVMQQDLDNLEWHLGKLKKSTLELNVTSVDGKEVTCSLDLQIIKVNVDLRDRLYGSK